MAGLTGQVGGGTFDADSLGLAAEVQDYMTRAQQNPQGVIDSGERDQMEQTVREKFIAQTGSLPTDQQVQDILGNRQVNVSSQQSLASRQFQQEMDDKAATRTENARQFDDQVTLQENELKGMIGESETLARRQQDIDTRLQLLSTTGSEVLRDTDGNPVLGDDGLPLTRTTLEAQRVQIAKDQQTLSEEIQGRQADLADTQEASANERFYAELTGRIGATGTVSAADLGITIPEGDLDPDLEKRIYGNIQGILRTLGLPDDPSHINLLMDGKSMSVANLPTLAATGQAQQANLEQQRIDLAAEQQDNADALQRAQLSGTLTDPKTGDSVQTLQAKQQDIDKRLEEIRIAQQGQQFLTEQTGIVAGRTAISADELGVNVEGAFNADGNPNFDRFGEIMDSLGPALTSAGLNPSGEQLDKLLHGEATTLDRQESLEARRVDIQANTEEGQLALAQEAQDLNEQIAKAQETGKWGEAITLSQQKLTVDAEIQRGQLELGRDTLNQQKVEDLTRAREERARLTGEFGGGTTNLADLGYPPIYGPDGVVNTDNFFLFADSFVDRFVGMTGRLPSAEEQDAIMRGQTLNLEGIKTVQQKQQ